MALSEAEIEAKLAALEERISLVAQATERFERWVEQTTEKWASWATELKASLTTIGMELDHIRKKVPLPPR